MKEGERYFVEVAVGEFLAGMSALDPRAVDEDADFVTVGEDAGSEVGDFILD